jgi:hypothetical protein
MKTTILFIFVILLGLSSAQNLFISDLFISEVAEGSSNNKYFEIFNPTASDIDLAGYAFATVSNTPSVPGVYEYWNDFTEGATIAAGDVYVVCHGSADADILAECDQTYTYLSNGDDGLCLAQGTEESYTLLDCVGDFNDDPGSGWDVAGETEATKDHTLVRKSNVIGGNGGDWEASSGTSADDSEWIVLDKDDWTNLGSHNLVMVTEINVDASSITVGSLYIGGGATGDAQAFPMVDNGDGIWTANVTFSQLPGYYIVLNSPTHADDWGTKEVLTGLPCGDPLNYNDRTMTLDDYVNGYKNITFGNCCPAPAQFCVPGGSLYAYPVVKINVDASNIAVGTVGTLYIGGGATGDAQAFPMDDNGDGIWTANVTFRVSRTFFGDYTALGHYTILNNASSAYDWGKKENLTGLPCGDPENYNDRTMTLDDYDNGYKNIIFGNCQLNDPCYTDCDKLRECYNTAPCSCGSTNLTCISYKTAFDAVPCCA